jgi:type VI secretion system protein ImpH
MGTCERETARDLTGTLLPQARRHHFFQLVERIYQLHDDNLEQILDIRPEDERIRYQTDPALGFPVTEVSQASVDAAARYHIQIAFLGIHGGASPLPHHYLEQIAYEAHQQIGVRADFFDFFNHRLITLLHRGWRKYRYYVRFRPEANDRFSQAVFSLIGLNDISLRGDTKGVPWSRLLTYAGMIATRSRAPSMIANIVAHSFDLAKDKVKINEFQPYHTPIPLDQRTQLGTQNGQLGQSFSIGERVYSIGGKFSIEISGLTQARFREFLPDGNNYQPLENLVAFLLRDQLAYDLELGLLQEEIPPMQLHPDRKQGCNLGWTTFLGQAALKKETTVRIPVRS